MLPDPNAAAPDPNDEPCTDLDPAELKSALGRTGRMLKTAGLPFELDEFDAQDEADAAADAPSATSSTGGDPEAEREPGDAGGPPA